jgi:hypothetical protein
MLFQSYTQAMAMNIEHDMTSVSKHTRSEVFNVDMERGYKGESA